MADGGAEPLVIGLLFAMSFFDHEESYHFLLRNFSLRLNRAPGMLKARSSIIENIEKKGVFMRRLAQLVQLVQLATRRWLRHAVKDLKFADEALDLLRDIFSNDYLQTWDMFKAPIVHADAILELTSRPQIAPTVRKCSKMSPTYRITGQYAVAEIFYAEVVKTQTEILGVDCIGDASRDARIGMSDAESGQAQPSAHGAQVNAYEEGAIPRQDECGLI